MTQVTYCNDQARARRQVEQITRAVLAAAADRRQGIGRSKGERSPAGLGQPRRALVSIEDRQFVEVQNPHGRGMVRMETHELLTPLGHKTARGALPPVLRALDEVDPRLAAALMFAGTVERIGAVKGADPAGGDIKGGASDGGVTTKIKHVSRFHAVRDAVNGWVFDEELGRVVRGRERVVLKVKRQRGSAKDITAFDLLWAVCVEGQDMLEILRGRGWSGHSAQRKELAAALLDLLDCVRSSLGVAR